MTSVVERWTPVIAGGKGWKEACFGFWLRQEASYGINALQSESPDQFDPGWTQWRFCAMKQMSSWQQKGRCFKLEENKDWAIWTKQTAKTVGGVWHSAVDPPPGEEPKSLNGCDLFSPLFLSRHGLNRDLSPSHARYSRSWHKNDIWPESKFICGLGATALAKESLWLRSPLFIITVSLWISKQWKGQAGWPQVPSRSGAAEEGRLFAMQMGDKDTTSIHHDGKKEECGGKIGGERSSCRCLIHAYGWHNVTVMQFVLGQEPSCSHPPQFRWLICRWRCIKEQLLMLLTRVRGRPSLLDVTAW